MVTTVGDDTEPHISRVEPLKTAIRHYWIPLALALIGAATALAPVPFGVAGCFVLILVTYAVARVQAGEAVALARLRRPISSAPISFEGSSGPIT